VTILVVDDDRELRELIGFVLTSAGYAVIEAGDGLEALRRQTDARPDLVILDVNLPGLDGFEVCRRMRLESDTPVMMLTVRGEESDQVRGLDLGADDYLAKPFSPRTLLARVRALLRRRGDERPAPLAAGAIALDPDLQTVRIGGATPVRLTNLEFRLLQLLVASPNRTLPPERLLRHVWGHRTSGDRHLLKQLVHRVRQKVEVDPAAPRHIKTVAGVGYRLEIEDA
jgi:DNA-binding response OmpR family regulator